MSMCNTDVSFSQYNTGAKLLFNIVISIIIFFHLSLDSNQHEILTIAISFIVPKKVRHEHVYIDVCKCYILRVSKMNIEHVRMNFRHEMYLCLSTYTSRSFYDTRQTVYFHFCIHV